MDKRSYLILITVFLVSVLLGGCGSYKPPYDRGYEAGYAAGVAAAGGSVSEGAVADTAPAKSALTSMTSKTEDEASEEVSEASSEEAGTEEAEHGGTVSGSEVMGEGSEPSGETEGGSGIPDGRVILADAVNEALYSNPEVIDGLREIYPDNAIFGEFVGESENNLLHKVGGSHFSELGYDTIVVFDGSKSVQDILDEGFYSKCSCMDE